MSRKISPEHLAKLKAGRNAGLSKFENQVIVIDKNWRIRRADEFNWIIEQKTKETWQFKGFYGKLTAALQSLPAHALNSDAKDSLQQVLELLKGLSYSIRAALPTARNMKNENQQLEN